MLSGRVEEEAIEHSESLKSFLDFTGGIQHGNAFDFLGECFVSHVKTTLF